MRPDYEDMPPKADAMIASMRAIGYDLPMALADIIDNSISARAGNVWIDNDWADGNPWIRIKDSGEGMTEAELREAMRLGTKGPNEPREPDDLGRFGLGLKTASFSQCRLFSVRSKTADGEVSTRCWNLDIVEQTKSWTLGRTAPKGAEPLLDVLDDVKSGTVVLWQNLDRVVGGMDDSEKAMELFLNKFIEVRKYLEMVFHRYLAGPKPLKIFMGRTQLRPWDPFLTSNTFTHPLTLSEKYEDGSVQVVPYILPHVSNRNKMETERGAGPKGWNAQQGFYVYRNRRMIVSGGYLDFDLKPEEHYKLARIMVDLKNDMDGEWRIDVRKAAAIPPDRLRADLGKVARATRDEAVNVYRARTSRSRKQVARNAQEVWVKRRRGDKIIYEINRDNEAIKRILAELSPPDVWTRKLFYSIERTLPHRDIVLDTCGNEDCHVDLSPDVNPPDRALVDLCVNLYRERRAEGRPHDEAADLVLAIEPFNTHPVFRAHLDRIMEDEG